MPIKGGFMNTMTAILLAGGESTRFWPLTHKVLTSFLGKPLLSWHYDQFLRFGIRNCIVITKSGSEKSIQSVTPPKGLSVRYVKQSLKGQGNGVLASEDANVEGPLFIVNASEVYDDLLFKEMKERASKDPDALIVGVRNVSSYFPGGYMRMKKDGSIEKIIEKPKVGTEPSTLISIGAYIVPNASLLYDALRKARKNPNAQFENAINILLENDTTGLPVSVDAPWFTLKYPWHVLSVMDAALSSIGKTSIDPSVQIGKHVVIEGPVVIGKHVKICEGVKIVGPTYIGADSVIGNNSMVRQSHIGERVVTGYSTEITRSYVSDDCWFHTNYIGDSVLGSNVSFGSGCVTANLRLDESNIFSMVKQEKIDTERQKLGVIVGECVRFGVQGSTMPGVKVGRQSIVGAGIIVSEDLPDESYCRRSESVVITKNTRTVKKDRSMMKKKL